MAALRRAGVNGLIDCALVGANVGSYEKDTRSKGKEREVCTLFVSFVAYVIDIRRAISKLVTPWASSRANVVELRPPLLVEVSTSFLYVIHCCCGCTSLCLFGVWDVVVILLALVFNALCAGICNRRMKLVSKASVGSYCRRTVFSCLLKLWQRSVQQCAKWLLRGQCHLMWLS